MVELVNRAEFEQRLAEKLAAKLGPLFDQLSGYLSDDPSIDEIPAEFWDAVNADFRDTLRPMLEEVFQVSADAVKTGVAAQVASQVDWSLVNELAATWARQYTYDLVKDLTDTTRQQVADAISSFFQDQLSMGELRDKLTQPFGAVRSALIASTEVTRASVQGEFGAVKQIEDQTSLKLEPTYQTSEDEHVCEICDPLDGQVVTEDNYPPLHPACRCWLNWEVVQDA